jgi:predicted MFS family arabinose efflux permease
MSSTTSSAAADARRVSLLVGLLFGLAGMGSSSAAIALPVLADDLGVSTGVSAWAISLYALMLAVATAASPTWSGSGCRCSSGSAS